MPSLKSSLLVVLATLFQAECHSTGLVVAPRSRHQMPMAMVLPSDSIAEIIVIDGGLNFLNLYQGVLTIRILLSWFPQAQGIGLLQPIFTASDVYLNLFRGVIPPSNAMKIKLPFITRDPPLNILMSHCN